jgi:hypothetical protein
MSCRTVDVVSHILRAAGVAMIVVGFCLASATLFADDPGAGGGPVPICSPIGGVCVELNGGCPPRIPNCDFHAGVPNCSCA